MTEYLSVEDGLGIAAIAIGALPAVRDVGLLDLACHRPAAQAWGGDAHPDLLSKAAALLESMTNNHALIDGNKRTAWLATVVFLRLNGATVTAVVDCHGRPARMVLAVATSDLRSTGEAVAAPGRGSLRSYQGQTCLAGSRLIVHKSVKDDLIVKGAHRIAGAIRGPFGGRLRVIAPTRVLAWFDFLKDCTRFRFD